MALLIFNATNNGMGGIDWQAAVDLFAPMYGVEDIEGLVERMAVIKSHIPRTEGMQ
jgi:hypothetical protein